MKMFGLIVITILLVSPVFGDETTPLLPFEDALQLIIDRSPDVGIQKAKLLAIEARNLSSHLAFLPTLDIEGKDRFKRGFGETGVEEVRSIEGTLRFNLVRFGADLASQRRAEAEEKAQSLFVQNSILVVERQGTTELVTFIAVRMEGEIQKKIVKMRRDSLRIAERRFLKGLLPQQEVDKISVDLDNARAKLRDVQSRLVRAEAALISSLGHSRVVMEWPWKEKLEQKTVVESTESELKGRPDWMAGISQVETADQARKESWGKMLPSLDLSASYGFTDEITGGDNGTHWTGMVTLTIPLFDRLSKYGSYKEQVHNKKIAELEFEKVKREARRQWQSSKGEFQIALETAKARDKTLETARGLYKTNLKRFRLGRASANDLIVDQDRLFESELFAILGWRDAHLNFTDLCHSIGHKVIECLKTR